VAAYPYRPPSPADEPSLLFVGKLDFRPNAEAVRWLVERVLPAVPDVRLFVVGARPPAWLVEAGQHDSRIAVVGHVQDERPYLARCALLALPVRVAAGSRLKALVAMASGLPVLSTAIGMEGLDAEAGVDYVQADSAEDWAKAIARLLQDVAARERIASSARALVERQYDWSAIRPALAAAYEQLSA